MCDLVFDADIKALPGFLEHVGSPVVGFGDMMEQTAAGRKKSRKNVPRGFDLMR